MRAVAVVVVGLTAAGCGAPVPTVQAPAPAPLVPPPVRPLGERSLARIRGDHHVYVVLNGERHHITDRRTLVALGFRYEDIREYAETDVLAIPEGFPFETDRRVNQLLAGSLSTLPDRTLVRATPEGRVFMIVLGQRHWISKKDTVTALGVDADHITEIPPEQLTEIPEGPAW